jgi:hypothetical protein
VKLRVVQDQPATNSFAGPPSLSDRFTAWDRFWGFPFGVIGLLGTVFGVYQWYESRVEIDPTMIVDPQHTVLIQRDQLKAAPVRVVRRDGALVDRDITGVRVFFWNDGRKPLFREDVLEPFRLFVQEPAEILDFRVLKVSRPAITQLAVRRIETASNQLSLDFRLLERMEGVSIQLIVAGDPNAPVWMEGVAVGSQKITTADSAALTKHPWYWFASGGVRPLAGIAVLVYLCFAALSLVKALRRARDVARTIDGTETTREERAEAKLAARTSTKSAWLEAAFSVVKGGIFYMMLTSVFTNPGHSERGGRYWVLDIVPDSFLDQPVRPR